MTVAGRSSGIVPSSVAVLVVLAALSGAMPVRAQTEAPDPEDLSVARAFTDALTDGDAGSITPLLDFELLLDEGLARGTAERGWDDLEDDIDRILTTKEIVEEWIDDEPGFTQGAFFVSARGVADPDAGRGPVPDRRYLQVVLRNPRFDQRRDLVIGLSPERRVIRVEFGELYTRYANPLGEEGLLPTPLPSGDEPLDDVHLLEQIDEFERDAIVELVDELLALDEGRERDEAIEALHRSPRASVTAVIQRLVDLDESRSPDPADIATLGAVLERITGRESGLSSRPGLGRTESDLRTDNHAAIVAWVRWHRRYGQDFTPTDIEDPLSPTASERARATDTSIARARAERLDGRSSSDEASGSAARPEPEPERRPATPPAPTPDPEPATPPSPSPSSTGGDGTTAPTPEPTPPTPRKIPTPRDILFTGAADLTIEFGGRRVVAREVEAELAPEVRELLNEWASLATHLDLDVILGATPGHVLMGDVSDAGFLARASEILDDAYRLLDEALPPLPGRKRTAVLGIVLDEGALRSYTFESLLGDLVERRLLRSSELERFVADPRGITLRRAPLFIQPTSALSDDPEFSATNELAHKFAQCLVTTRAGEQPTGLLWGFGHLTEMRLFDTVYQFNTSGFVSAGSHSDWPVMAKQFLRKRAKKRGFSLGQVVIDAADGDARTLEAPQLLWGWLDFVLAQSPGDLGALLADLAALHAQVDTRGRATIYVGPVEEMRETIDAWAAEHDVDAMVERLDAM